MKDCLFCQILSGEKSAEIIARFDQCFVMKDQYPVSKGHLLIIPYKHVETWFDADTIIQQDMMNAVNQIKKYLDFEYKPDGYNFGANCGRDAGQTVMHLHIHLIPRYKGDVKDSRGGVRGVIPEKQKY